MEEIVAKVNFTFDIERELVEQVGACPLPFSRMDKSGSAICEFFLKGICVLSAKCPFRHVKGGKAIVCKHWFRGLCKKGDICEFLHEYNMEKMPECYFYSKFNACSNKGCPFLHIDPETKIKNCPWYDRGFCRHGPTCKHRHVKRTICIIYLTGFCPDGPHCKYTHPKFDLPELEMYCYPKRPILLCHYCKEAGHKILYCPNIPPEHIDPAKHCKRSSRQANFITCYKCGEKGHYANKCAHY